MAASSSSDSDRSAPDSVRIFLCGDVMLGRGIDQILPSPCPPTLHEDFVRSALDYVRLAEQANGPFPRRVGYDYVWGAALDEFRRAQPDIRIVNLETSVTRSDEHAPKGINYRMSPENAACLTAADIDCCVLANNHVLDWGRAGLLDTLQRLHDLGIRISGAGHDLAAAWAPAVLEIGGSRRLLVLSFASVSSGTPSDWAATETEPGVNVLTNFSAASVQRICDQIAALRQPSDIVIVSVHWGSNWGYDIPDVQRRFAHALIDSGAVSIVYGHSSHHPKAVEVYRNRLVLYGCGDFLNDYEGICGYEGYRDDLAVMYFADVDAASGDLAGLEMVPLQIRRFQLARPSADDMDWLRRRLDREAARFAGRVLPATDARFVLQWPRKERLA